MSGRRGFQAGHAQAEEGLGENHRGEQRWESALAKGKRIIAGGVSSVPTTCRYELRRGAGEFVLGNWARGLRIISWGRLPSDLPWRPA